MLGFHPANLILRFFLEVAALAAMGVGAYKLTTGSLAWAAGIGVPVVAAAVWGVFNVPGDRSRSGKAPVVVPGAVRLLIELAFFALAVALLWQVHRSAAIGLGIATLIHYAVSIDRIRWLIGQPHGD